MPAPSRSRSHGRRLIKPVIFTVALLPFCYVLWRVFVADNLGPDPAQELAIETGEWTIRMLLLALAMTPLKQITGQVEFVRNRRMIGLFALFYATVHFLVWISFLLAFRWEAIGEELVERPFITVGFAAWLILLALGITSPKFMVRKLGRQWKRLHRLVYVAGILGLIHLLWIQRTDLVEVVFYGSILLVLLAYRVFKSMHKRRLAAARQS